MSPSLPIELTGSPLPVYIDTGVIQTSCPLEFTDNILPESLDEYEGNSLGRLIVLAILAFVVNVPV